jgi:hypothetical protein
MFNIEIMQQILSKYGNEFGSGKYHIYLYYHTGDESKAIEEEECIVKADWSGVLEIYFPEDLTTSFIAYEAIDELSFGDDRSEQRDFEDE